MLPLSRDFPFTYSEENDPCVLPVSSISHPRPLQAKGASQVYRMDKDDAYNTMASSLVNLARLMKNDENAWVDKEPNYRCVRFPQGRISVVLRVLLLAELYSNPEFLGQSPNLSHAGQEWVKIPKLWRSSPSLSPYKEGTKFHVSNIAVIKLTYWHQSVTKGNWSLIILMWSFGYQLWNV